MPIGLLYTVLHLALAALSTSGGGSSDDARATPVPRCPAPPVDAPIEGTATARLDVRWVLGPDGMATAAPIAVRVPPGTLSAMVALEADGRPVRLMRVTSGSDDVGPLDPFARPVASLHLAEQDIERAGPCLVVTPAPVRASADVHGALHVVVRRGVSSRSVVRVRPVLVGDAGIDPADLDAAMAHAAGIYASDDLRIEVAEPLHIPGFDGPVRLLGASSATLRALPLGLRDGTVPIFVVDTLARPDILGAAGGAPGPGALPHTPASGVIVSVAAHRASDAVPVHTTLLGETIAHELGHQLGLAHTTESDGHAHDPLDDTPTCDAARDHDHDGQLTTAECHAHGADNLMFWTAGADVRQTTLTRAQRRWIRDGVVARPDPLPAP